MMLIKDKFVQLELHGVIHVTQDGQYAGVIEFKGGFGPPKIEWAESAFEKAKEYWTDTTEQEQENLKKAIFKLFGF